MGEALTHASVDVPTALFVGKFAFIIFGSTGQVSVFGFRFPCPFSYGQVRMVSFWPAMAGMAASGNGRPMTGNGQPLPAMPSPPSDPSFPPMASTG